METRPDLFTTVSIIVIVLVAGGIIAGSVWQWRDGREAYEPPVVAESTPEPSAPYSTIVLDIDLPRPTGFGNDGWQIIEATAPPGWITIDTGRQFVFDDGIIRLYQEEPVWSSYFPVFTERELARLIESGEIPYDITRLIFPQNSVVMDLTPLVSLTYLEELFLPIGMENAVDISPLAELENLQISFLTNIGFG